MCGHEASGKVNRMPDDNQSRRDVPHLRPVPGPEPARGHDDFPIPYDVPNREFVVHAIEQDGLLQTVLKYEAGSSWPEQRQVMLDAIADRRAALAELDGGVNVPGPEPATPDEAEELIPPGPNHDILKYLVISDPVLLSIARLHKGWVSRCELMIEWLARNRRT